MKTTGQILKENRERKGITLNEVALATKINVKMLTAIEEGQIEKLPTKTFLRGFVIAYARYLGLDEEAILNTFFEEMGSTKPKMILNSETTPPQSASEARSTHAKALDPNNTSLATKIGAVLAILFLVVLIVVVKKKMESYENEAVISELPQEMEAVNRPDGTSESPTPDPTLAAVGAVTDSPTPTPDPALTLSATPTASPTPLAAPTATATVAPTATPAPTSTPAPTPTATPAPTATPTPSPTPSASASPSPTPAGRAQEVMIEAIGEVEVEAQVDNEASRKIKMAPDQVQTFKAKRKVILKFSDGGAVNLIVNGNDRGVPGDLGKPAKVELP